MRNRRPFGLHDSVARSVCLDPAHAFGKRARQIGFERDRPERDYVMAAPARRRNRGFGERVGRGEKPEAVLASMTSIAEGFPTARSARELARKLNISTPIIDEVYAMLYEGKNVRHAVQDLTTRESKAED